MAAPILLPEPKTGFPQTDKTKVQLASLLSYPALHTPTRKVNISRPTCGVYDKREGKAKTIIFRTCRPKYLAWGLKPAFMTGDIGYVGARKTSRR
jgi:hypothetical protein